MISIKISSAAAVVASQALRSAIGREEDFIAVLKSCGKADDITIAVFEKRLQEYKDAFKEVSGYDFDD